MSREWNQSRVSKTSLSGTKGTVGYEASDQTQNQSSNSVLVRFKDSWRDGRCVFARLFSFTSVFRTLRKIIGTSFGAFDVERTANSLYTFSLLYTPARCLKRPSWCSLCPETGVSPPPPSFSSSFTPPAASFNNAWDGESGEGKRERLHAKTVEEIHKGGGGGWGWGGQRGRRCLKTLLSFSSARWLDGRLWRGRRGQLRGGRGFACFSVLLPLVSFSGPHPSVLTSPAQ